jgi:hypothetical protein
MAPNRRCARLERFHDTIMTTVLTAVVSCFGSALEIAHQFHLHMTKEVQQVDPGLRPCVLTANETNGPEFKVTLDVLPIDLMDQLGIQVTQRQHGK